MQGTPKKIVLLVNDSYFSYLLAKDLIDKHHSEIDKIVFSKAIKNSREKIFDIFKKASLRFFVYRVFVFFLTNFFYRKHTVGYLAKKYKICVTNIEKLKDFDFEGKMYDIGFAFNFDIIINEGFLRKIKKGVFNIHASKLPLDKGISPVLWAFARGDKEIWSTIYKIDKGIDTGDIFRQFRIDVQENDSAFSLYERVCQISGKELEQSFSELINEPTLQKPKEINFESYFSWPDKNFEKMLIANKRKLFKFMDLWISKKN